MKAFNTESNVALAAALLLVLGGCGRGEPVKIGFIGAGRGIGYRNANGGIRSGTRIS